MDQMWRLDEFQYDESIPDGEVGVFDDTLGDEVVYMPRDRAVQMARSRGLHLIASAPAQQGDDAWCWFGEVALPPRWEGLPALEAPSPDELMWFEAPCGRRDYLLGENGHTFTGRMLAWCPHDDHHVYSVSLHEMGEMSIEARYFVRGFLAGAEPSPPYDDSYAVAEHDDAAWAAATRRFNRTGRWSGRWRTCEACGAVLLPSTTGDRCESHD